MTYPTVTRTPEEVDALIDKALTFGKKTHHLNKTSWTRAQLYTLISGWDRGASASIVANEIGDGKSRNAVIGKAHRMKLGKRAPSNGGNVGRPVKERLPSGPRKREGDVKKVVAPKFYPQAVPLTTKQPIGIMELTLLTCRAVVGNGPDGLAVYCGDMCFPDKPFCEGHAAMYYQPPDQRRRVR